MNDFSKVSINVQYATPIPSQQDEQAEVEILWGRIITAVLALVMLTCFVTWLFIQPKSNVTNSAQHASSLATVTASAKQEETTPDSTSNDASLQNMPETKDAYLEEVGVEHIDSIAIESENPVTSPASEPLIAAEASVNHPDTVKQAQSAPESTEFTTVEAIRLDANELAASKAKPEVTKNIDTAIEATSPNISESELANIYLHSPHVRSAQLGQRLKPSGTIEPLSAAIHIQPSQIAKILFVTKYEGLKNQWVYHDWYRNNVRMARIRLRPSKNKVKATSSKNIDSTMTGSWHVVVVDPKDTILAMGEFEVRHPQ